MFDYIISNYKIILSIVIFLVCLIIGYIGDKVMTYKKEKAIDDINNKMEPLVKKDSEVIEEQDSSVPPVFDKTLDNEQNINNMF